MVCQKIAAAIRAPNRWYKKRRSHSPPTIESWDTLRKDPVEGIKAANDEGTIIA